MAEGTGLPSMKYARIERERRFLLSGIPDGVDGSRFYRIRDIYLPGTRLRVRTVRDEAGTLVVAKLTQKYLDADSAGAAAVITNTYLDDAELELLSTLQGARLDKRRHRLVHEGTRYSVDVFENALAGLVLAEVEVDSDQAIAAVTPPPGTVREVTADPAFMGGRLATATMAEITRAVAAARTAGP